MKLLLLVTLALLGAASADLQAELDEVLALVPIEDLRQLAADYLVSDEEYRTTIEYFDSPEYLALTEAVEAEETVQILVEFLLNNTIDMVQIFQNINDIINGRPETPLVHKQRRTIEGLGHQTRNLRTYLNVVLAITPWEDIDALLQDKIVNSPDVAALYEALAAHTTHMMVHNSLQLETVQAYLNNLRELEVDVSLILSTVMTFLGWHHGEEL